MTLIDQYREMHRDPDVFSGQSVLPYAHIVKRLIRLYNCKSLLDYGCGKGAQYGGVYNVHKWWGIMPTLYDPAVTRYEEKPSGKFHGVICTDVLEHLEEDDIPGVLDDLFRYAERWVFVTVCSRESNRMLPDGRNCHITIQSRDWWRLRLAAASHRNGSVKFKMAVTP